MAKFTVKLAGEYSLKLERLRGSFDEAGTKAIEAAAEIICDEVRSNLNSALSGSSTGQLSNALGISPVKKDEAGNLNAKVGFDEPRVDRKGKSTYKHKLKSASTSEYKLTNAMIANIIEYGKRGQPARPFVQPAVRKTKKKALKAMQTVIDNEINKQMK